MIKDVKVVWKLACKHWRAFTFDVWWHLNHVKFYAKYISERSHKFDTVYGTKHIWADDHYRKPPLDPNAYPYDKEKAETALSEVRRWIEEEKSR